MSSIDIFQAAPPAPVKKDSEASKRRPRGNKSNEKKDDRQKKREYQPKLMIEEDVDKMTVLIKITRNTGIRQIINFVLPRIKSDWTVEMNAFSLDMTKAL